MVFVSKSFSNYYPSNWPKSPFHAGELQVQHLLGVQEYVNTYAPRVVRPFMPDQHRDFYQGQPFLVVAARDTHDHMWATLLFASTEDEPSSSNHDITNFISSPNPTKLLLKSRPLQGDALDGSLQAGSDLGILGIEFATRRRNRVNGRIISNDNKSIEFHVDQSFGNCPQYIKPRDWWMVAPSHSSKYNSTTQQDDDVCQEVVVVDSPTDLEKAMRKARRPDRLTPKQIKILQSTDTIFVATGYRGEGEDPRWGNDASHRGGNSFLDVDPSGKRLILPDYSGNNHFNTIGNLVMDHRMGITIPILTTGGMIQLTGNATIIWDDNPLVQQYTAANRLIQFDIKEVVELEAGSLPIRWDSGNNDIQVQVYQKVQESKDVTSFYLTSIAGDKRLPTHKPGQHITLKLKTKDESTIDRSYSISNYDISEGVYRISVKHNPFGVVSTYLHDHVQVDDILTIQKEPSGDFIYDDNMMASRSSNLILFLSAGSGVTPILSMLHAFVQNNYHSTEKTTEKKKAIWLHSARDPTYHPFREEVVTLTYKSMGTVTSATTYTRSSLDDSSDGESNGIFHGRIDKEMISKFIAPGSSNYTETIEVFICGPGGFIGTMMESLNELGVDPKRVHYETF